MMGFSIHIQDLPRDYVTLFMEWQVGRLGHYNLELKKQKSPYNSESRTIKFDHLGQFDLAIKEKYPDNYSPVILIAAVKQMFSEDAFDKTQARIPKFDKMEAPAKHEVDLDPIVLCRINGGYLIITAWGDEANDELVVNAKNN